MVVCACSPNTWLMEVRGRGGKGQPWLHSEFQTSLCCIRCCQKTTMITNKQRLGNQACWHTSLIPALRRQRLIETKIHAAHRPTQLNQWAPGSESNYLLKSLKRNWRRQPTCVGQGTNSWAQDPAFYLVSGAGSLLFLWLSCIHRFLHSSHLSSAGAVTVDWAFYVVMELRG